MPRPVTRARLIAEAASLASEDGENREYDRALAELIYWAAGGVSALAVTEEIQAAKALAAKTLAAKRGR